MLVHGTGSSSGWQTFISNAGVLQYFGSRDHETAKYVEHLLGMTTMRKRSISFGSSSSATSSFGQGGGSSTSGSSENTSYDDVQRPLAYADEMMTLHRDLQVLFVENRYPIVAEKRWWFRHQEEATSSEGKET
ncbi:type IV secretory system conjugative DNA transfer family protein [Hyphomonas sp.]|uniref:type IV secretory system conjugative DNA transfer family protein n=1 Tax=Hyphomonas sp. TaxID=87 RepID=UPI00263626E0|nr:type IV secretory system conjugative DNA transfer family protein [Hyphomonas sp.]MDF1807768.1 type IV secretory system conjugative DNA transfer family protein [Hyphomonas sp.]